MESWKARKLAEACEEAECEFRDAGNFGVANLLCESVAYFKNLAIEQPKPRQVDFRAWAKTLDVAWGTSRMHFFRELVALVQEVTGAVPACEDGRDLDELIKENARLDEENRQLQATVNSLTEKLERRDFLLTEANKKFQEHRKHVCQIASALKEIEKL